MKRILMVAYHFPPLAGSSGIQRTLRFSQHLPGLGWEPLILSTHPRAYERTSDDLLGELPADLVVRRAFALDTARHLTIFGRYLGLMARPDRWVSWKFDGVRQGLKLIREFKPEVIWSTYPVATAHLIAAKLHKKTGIPWIADFRDPMAQEGYPADPLVWNSFRDIEIDAATHAKYCVFTTPSAAQDFRDRYPAASGRVVVLENGYDEESFLAIPTRPRVAELLAGPARGAADQAQEKPIVMLHSGIVYPSERDPTQFFMALSRLHKDGLLSPQDLQIRFRGSVHEVMLRKMAREHGAHEFIEVCGPISYRDALGEMMSVDGLLVMQASNCNAQIPAKVYEYLRAGRPILALTDSLGDTAGVLRDAGLTDIIDLASVDQIHQWLPEIIRSWREGRASLPRPDAVRKASRRGRTEQLAEYLDRASGSRL